MSVQFGSLEATKAFVESGAAINNTNIYGVTPLMVAQFKGKFHIFHFRKNRR